MTLYDTWSEISKYRLMAFTFDYGEADPFVSDVVKTLTLSTVARGGSLPSQGEIFATATGLGVYWFLVHKWLGDNLVSKAYGVKQ